jgi:hypothetical protein
MIKVDKISTSLYGIVGLRQPFNPTYDLIDDDNQISRSGLFVTDNPFVKIEYLFSSQDYKDIDFANFNVYLKRIQESSIINVCHKVFNRFDYLDRSLLYKNAQNKVNQEVLNDGFVGYRIKVSDDDNIAFKIKRVLLDFDTVGDFKLMLFNTSKLEPLFSQDITITDKTQEVELNWDVDNSGITYKGDYYLGYIKTGTTPIPYTRDYENSERMSCISHLDIEKVQCKNHLTETLFDLDDEDSLSEDVGINPDIVVYEDFTDLVISNEMLFARAIQLDMTIAILRESSNSLRSNGTERQGEQQAMRILAEIEGQKGQDVLTITGLRPLLMSELNQLEVQIDRLKTGYFNNRIRVSTLN